MFLISLYPSPYKIVLLSGDTQASFGKWTNKEQPFPSVALFPYKMNKFPTFCSRIQYKPGNSRMPRWVEASFPCKDGSVPSPVHFTSFFFQLRVFLSPFQELCSSWTFLFLVNHPHTFSFLFLEPQHTQQHVWIFLSHMCSRCSLESASSSLCAVRKKNSLQV